jgi:outer membrane protein TolC
MIRTSPSSPLGLVFVLLLFSSSLAASQEEASAPTGEASAPPVVVRALQPPRDVMESIRGTGLQLTADRAAEIAAATAASIEHADALLAAARAGADRARYGFIPRLDVVASYTRIPTNEQRLVPNSVSRDIDAVSDPAARDLFNQQARVLKNRYSVTGTLTFPVSDYFLEIWPRYESAQGFAEAREYGVEAERARVALSAREAYYAYARARAAAAVQKLVLDQAEQSAQLVETRARQGQVYRAEELQVRAELANARATLVRSEGGVEIAGTALRAMLELEPGTPIALQEDFLAELPASVETPEVLTKRAISSRAEARALRRIIEARGLAVDAAQGSRLPSLVLQGQAEVGSPNSRLFIERSDPQAIGYVSVALSWSLDETLQGGPAAREQRAARNQARADLRVLEEAIRTQVAKARVAYEAALRTREAAELSQEAARESYRLRVAEFERGRALATEVLEAVAALARAEMGVLSAAVDGRVALAQLERAVGTSDVTPHR